MKDFLQDILATTEKLQAFREKHKKSRIETINKKKIPLNVKKDDKGETAMFTFGEMLCFHLYEDREDQTIRSRYYLAYRALMEDAIEACKLAAAEYLIKNGANPELTGDKTPTKEDEKVVDALMACIESIVFGEKHGLLLSQKEFSEQFKDKTVPFTYGIFLEVNLSISVDNNPDVPIDVWLNYAVGRYIKTQQDPDKLYRVILESSLGE